MHFIKVGSEFVNLEKVAKVKVGQNGITVVYEQEQVMASRFTGEDARDLRHYLDSIAIDTWKETYERVQ